MPFELLALPYAKDALAPFLSAETFDYHYEKHHAAYVANLNKLTEGTEFANLALEGIIAKAGGGIFNNAAQIYNHSFFWNCMKPDGGGEPSGDLAAAIAKEFGSFAEFKQKFSTAAATLFGSGWTWLVKTESGGLEIVQMPNAGTPIKEQRIPLLTLDVWEHAYYIDYRNARPKFIEGFWGVVNWDHVARQFAG